ncbi:MAG: PAS domain S-box protein [Bacteroidota bacterium]|nr:PAS domain S-box protein [Bacteroidota bacterium]
MAIFDSETFLMTNDNIYLKYIDSSEYFQSLANAIPEIIILVDPVYFKIKYINHIQPGYNKNDVLGADVFNFVYPEHINQYRKILNETIVTKQTNTIELETLNPVNENGKAWYYCTISPINNKNDQIESLLIISKDVTSIKLQEIEVHDKKEKLYAIINNTKDVITSIDRNLNLTEYNSVFGSLVEQGFGKIKLIETNILNYIDPKKHDHLKAIYAKVFNGENVTDIESFEMFPGKKFYMETSYHPINNFNQKITGISIFSRDITERVINDQKLKNTIKEREILLAEIHHRIKNNLAIVSSMLQLKELNLDNEIAKIALSDSRKRIKSTALVHEMLYRNDTFDNIKLHDYITELFKNLNSNPSISLILEGENYVLDHNKALPFGLLVHELMMNSFKHSFKGREKAKLKINSKVTDKVLNIEYCDCSGTFANNVDFYNTATTGLMLIHTFIEQLEGSIKLTCKEPPAYSINIPLS